ncbi:hypothetical protein V2J09_012141 [Rumex salicifolius]
MAETSSALRQELIQLSEPVRESLLKTNYKPSESDGVCIKSELLSLLPSNSSVAEQRDLRVELRDFALCCALLSSSSSGTSSASLSGLVSWIPSRLSFAANDAFSALAAVVCSSSDWEQSVKVEELGLELDLTAKEDERLVIDLIPDLLPLIKDTIKNSSIDGDEDGDEVSAASARTPVAYAAVASRQFRWFVNHPNLGKLCGLILPCALTALDHWSPGVKEQGMLTFIHLAKNVKCIDFGCYEDVVLDACCHNIVSNDEIWHIAVEMSVILLTSTKKGNPRSPWFEKMLTEMIGQLERQPRSKERRIPWLQLIEPMLCTAGLVLLGHFRRLFPLFFQWMHADDDETLILVLKRMHTVVKVTWIRKSPYIERLVDELSMVYRESATRVAREEIRSLIKHILVLLQQCKGIQFEKAWEKHKDSENMRALCESMNVT